MDVDQAIELARKWPGIRFEATAAATVLADEVERLRAIVDRLPKTADGVPLFPGDTVYYEKNPSNDTIVAFTVAPYSEWNTDVWGVQNQSRAVSKKGGGWPAAMCYSTRKAAEAAKEATDG
jgi:hypothetical protein